MGLFELFCVGIGLSMDAFAAAVSKGTVLRKPSERLVMALLFGGFQAMMPIFGWLLGERLAPHLYELGHVISFLLLAYIGGHMVWEAFKGEEETGGGTSIRELLALAVATSIDALAVGVSFALLKVEIATAAAVIGCTTFVLSMVGASLGCWAGCRYQRQAETVGGLILIFLGVRFLLS